MFFHGIIGAERESLNKPAGFKTHSLIGISAVIITLTAETLFNNFGGDIARIPAQLLAGIGFIGAGTILTDGFNVKGLTTAASLLAVTCLGIAIGSGLYVIGITFTFLVYMILSYAHINIGKSEKMKFFQIKILDDNNEKTIENIEKAFKKHKFDIKKISKNINKTSTDIYLYLEVYCTDYSHINKIIKELNNIKSIIKIELE